MIDARSYDRRAMKQVFRTEDSVAVELARNFLQDEGIECRLMREMASGAFAPVSICCGGVRTVDYR